MANPGKKFEKNVSDAAKRQHIFCLRLRDTDIAFDNFKQKLGNTSFVQKQPCDYIFFWKGMLFPIEMKSTCGKSISFARNPDDKTLIKAHQINSLINFDEYEGVCPGLLLNFRTEDDNKNILDEDTYFIHIKDFSQFMYDSDKNSINKLDLINYNAMIVESKKLRKYFTYNIKGLFDKLIEQDWVKEET